MAKCCDYCGAQPAGSIARIARMGFFCGSCRDGYFEIRRLRRAARARRISRRRRAA